MTIFRENFHGI